MENLDYEAEMAKIQEEVKRLAFQCDEWTLRKSTPKIKVSTMNVPYSKNAVFKVDALLDVEPAKCLDMVDPVGQYRLKWDPFCLICTQMKPINQTIHMVYGVTKPQVKGIIKSRDTIDLFQMQTEEQYRSCIFASIHYDEDIPLRKPHFVRGWNYPSGLFFSPVENPKQTNAILVLNVNMSLQVMNISIPFPPILQENIMVSKLCQYMTCLDKTSTSVKWKPQHSLTSEK